MSWDTEATKKAKKAAVQGALERSDEFVVHALKAVYARQTADERGAGVTVHSNGRGFTGFDAIILSSFAKQVSKWEADSERRFSSPLSPKQMATARKMMPKYWAQLIEVADEKAKAAPALVEAAKSGTSLPLMDQWGHPIKDEMGNVVRIEGEDEPVYCLDGDMCCETPASRA